MVKGISKETLKTWTDRKLIIEAKSLYELIHITECFGTKDLLLLELIARELEKRGFETKETRRLVIAKKK